MSQSLVLKAKGLYTNVNELSEIPEGGMTKADNVFIDRDGIVETRRGFKPLTYKLMGDTSRPRNFFLYQDELFVHYGVAGSENKLAYLDDTLLVLNGTTTIATATVTAISSTFNIRTGMTITGTGIPANTFVQSVDSATQITMTQNATASGTVAITYAGWRDFTGTYLAPDSTFGRLRATQANSNAYIITAEGVKKLDSVDGTIVNAGGIKAINGEAVTTGATGYMPNDSQVAYQIVWAYKDANNNLILGTPSSRITVSNSSGGTRDVNVTIFIPDGITVNHFYQLYRSAPSATVNDEPGAELNLVYEANPTSAEIIAKQLTVLDNTPEDLRSGATLYTSPSQEGDLQANEPPPFAKDITFFQDSVFYANTRTKHRLFLTLLAVSVSGSGGINFTSTTGDISIGSAIVTNIPSTTGLEEGQRVTGAGIPANTAILTVDSATQVTLTNDATATTVGVALSFFDVLTIAGVEYYAAAAQNVTNREFQVYTAGTPGQNIDFTIKSLITVINTNTSNTTVYAYYLSGFDDLPGKMLIEERNIGGSSFTALASSHGDSWNPNLPTTGSSVISSNDEFKNAVYFSKPGQPEAVPIVNIFRVGTAEKQILRIIPLREALFVLKEDGIYRVTGVSGQFRVDLLDNTATLVSTESAVPLNNQIYMLADQGVATVSDTGVSVVSRAIERDFLFLFSQAQEKVAYETFAVAYETERKYVLFIVSNDADVNPTQVYTYNTFTNSWTKWIMEKRCGIVSTGDGRMYLGDGTTNVVNQERKDRLFTDYCEDEYVTTLDAASVKTLELADDSNVEVGDVLYQNSVDNSIVRIVDNTVSPAQIVVEDLIDWDVGQPITILKAIPVDVEFAPATGKNPGLNKHFKEISLFFKDVLFSNLQIGFSSELSSSREYVDFEGFGVGFWGLFPWGSGPWGGQQRALAIRTYVPGNKQRCSQLTIGLRHREAFSFFSCQGMSLIYDFMSERLAR